MFNLKSLFSLPYGYYDYSWVEVKLIHETKKAILVDFDGKKAWLPKAWIIKIKKEGKAAKIKISLYYWAKEFT